MGYRLHPTNDGKSDLLQTDGTAFVFSEMNYNTGRAKGLGASQTLLSNLAAGRTLASIYGSRVLDKSHTDKALTAGTFAYTVGDVIRRVTTTLSGVSKDRILSSGASNWGTRKAIKQVTAIRTVKVATAIRAGYWNIYSASFSSGPDTANDFTTIVTQGGTGGGSGADEAANPSDSKPGELVYHAGILAQPTQADYPAKTG